MSPSNGERILDRLGRMLGLARYLNRPETRKAVEQRVESFVMGAVGRLEQRARETEQHLTETVDLDAGRPHPNRRRVRP